MKIAEKDIVKVTPEVVFEMDGKARKARYTGNMILLVGDKSADVVRSYVASEMAETEPQVVTESVTTEEESPE